jgi:thiol-disulfide isomerase/thioredoxin
MIAINIGIFALPVSPLLAIISVLIGFMVASLVAKTNKDSISNALFTTLLVGLVFGRLVFVLRFADSYDSFWQMLDIRDRGIDYMAAVLCSAFVLLIQLRKRQQRKALLSGVLTMAGLYAVFMVVISAGTAQSSLPDTPFRKLDGKTVSLPELSQKKPMVVNLWASWCPPCQREMPVLEKAEQQHSDVTFVLLNQKEPSEIVMRFLTRQGLDFKHVIQDNKGDMASQMGAFGLPVTLYFDAEGQLVHSHMGELSSASLQQSIEQYF